MTNKLNLVSINFMVVLISKLFSKTLAVLSLFSHKRTGSAVIKCPKLFIRQVAGDCDYRRIPVVSPGLIQLRKGFWVGL